jgi:hypothetical protein
MRCGPIEIDDQIIEALEKDQLVVFAGAGISMPPPSCLPSFARLADQIAKMVGVQRQNKEPEDRFLGRLEDGDARVQVHPLARSLLIREDSKHTELHELLLQLFQSPSMVRIVTTNFDGHFNTAAKVVFGDDASDMIVHHGPALPLGDEFSGLIYVHGALHEPHNRCVMTDRDFGAAYLTLGWARRFLLRLFAKYTVLFVGYSHEDTVMNYLARGMPGTGSKFAFVPLGEEANWNFQHIKCVSYRKHEADNTDNKHLQITEACREWVAELALTPTQRHKRLQHLYEKGPASLKEQDKDFVCRCLASEDLSHGFFRNTPKKPWIAWMLESALLNYVFDRSVQLNDHQHRIMSWAIFDGFLEAESLLWKQVQTFNFCLNPSASRMIAIQIQQRDRHTDDVFRKWLSVLLHQPEGNLSLEQLARLIEACKLPDEAEVALTILATQLKPKVEANSWRRILEEELGVEPSEETTLTLNTCSHSMHELRTAWNDHLNPHLRSYPFLALQTFVSLLIEHRSLTKLIQPHDEEDLVSRSRENVEPGHEISGSDAIDLIITGAVQSLEAWLLSNHGSFDDIALAWDSLDVPVLRRIVVHGQSKRLDWSADQKLDWLMRQDCILGSDKNREANLLILRHYETASEPTRFQVIQWLESWTETVPETKLTQRTFDIFSMFSWLASHTKCEIAQEALDRVKMMVPEDLAPWEHPEVGACSLPDSHFRPKSADLVTIDAAETPAEKLEVLLETIQLEKHQHHKYDIIQRAVKAGRDDVDWAIGFQSSLIARNVQDVGVWSVLFQLWREKDLSTEEWNKLLRSWAVIQAPFVKPLDLVVDLLNGRVASQPYPMPPECREIAGEIMIHCWAETQNAPYEEPNADDVVFFALNHAPGQLAHFWVQYALLRRKETGNAWQGVPPEIMAPLVSLVTSTSIRAEIASVMLCFYFDDLYLMSPNFVHDHLLPKLKWPEGGAATVWRWEAFLKSDCALPLGMTSELLPSFVQMLKERVLPEKAREHSLDFSAWLSIYRFENPLDNNWFNDFLQLLTDGEKVVFAHLVGVYLIKAQWENQTAYWRRWVLSYCQQRKIGVPTSPSKDEAREILLWILGSGDCLPDAVRTLLSWDVAPIEYSGPVLLEFEKTDHPEKHPNESTGLLARIIDLCSGVLAEKSVTKIYRRLEKAGAQPVELVKVREAAIKHGLNLETAKEEDA